MLSALTDPEEHISGDSVCKSGLIVLRGGEVGQDIKLINKKG